MGRYSPHPSSLNTTTWPREGKIPPEQQDDQDRGDISMRAENRSFGEAKGSRLSWSRAAGQPHTRAHVSVLTRSEFLFQPLHARYPTSIRIPAFSDGTSTQPLNFKALRGFRRRHIPYFVAARNVESPSNFNEVAALRSRASLISRCRNGVSRRCGRLI